ncbi:MAG: FGGY-family carbohydrate kinase, partial [Anaerolineae bacterium]|nr:FGGY-family carbohydrate kinase [Thermoflexales bacterium]MDW8408957.1 FGGY-family carbohydrate kinase [Anaerolineae bacterium]
ILDLDWVYPLLPPVCDPLQPRGYLTPHVARIIGLPNGMPVYVGPFDVLAAAIGAGSNRATSGISVWGTASIHQRWTDTFQACEVGYWVSHPQKAHHGLRFIATHAGMLNIDYWLQMFYDSCPRMDELDRQLSAIPLGARGLLYLPYLTASRERSESVPVAGASFVGIHARHTKLDYLRAVFEGLAIQAARLFRRLEDQRAPLTEVRIVGGGARSDLLAQLLADATGRYVIRPKHAEATLLGITVVALTGLGYANDMDQLAGAINIARDTFSPSPQAHAQLCQIERRFETCVELISQDEWWSASSATTPG